MIIFINKSILFCSAETLEISPNYIVKVINVINVLGIISPSNSVSLYKSFKYSKKMHNKNLLISLLNGTLCKHEICSTETVQVKEASYQYVSANKYRITRFKRLVQVLQPYKSPERKQIGQIFKIQMPNTSNHQDQNALIKKNRRIYKIL